MKAKNFFLNIFKIFAPFEKQTEEVAFDLFFFC